jgi:hypothetical protein
MLDMKRRDKNRIYIYIYLAYMEKKINAKGFFRNLNYKKHLSTPRKTVQN